VVGQKVFVMSEPGWKSDFPELVCLDLNTGKILWQKQIDHMEQAVSDPKRREQIRAAWASLLERIRIAFNLVEESAQAGSDEAKQAKVKEKVAAAFGDRVAAGYYSKGKRFGNQSSAGGYGVLRGWGAGDTPGPDPKHQVTLRDLKAAGLRLETFYGFGVAREGECFSTPASDGKFVYVVTEQGSHACFDPDGNLRWLTWIKPTFNPGGHDDSICRSPLVVDGLFITDLHVDRDTNNKANVRANPVIALDCATGKRVWQAPLPWGEGKGLINRDHSCASAKVMDVGGARLFITSGGHVLRVKDGKVLATIVFSTPQNEIGTDDASDTVFYIPGAGQGTKKELAAVKLEFQGEALNQKEVWRVPVQGVGYTMAVYQGRVYTGCEAVEIATGKVTSWGGGGKGRVPTRWLLAIAGGRLYGLKEDGTATVLDLTGKVLAVNKVVTATDDPDLIARHLAVDGNRQWEGKRFSYSSPFTFVGNRILMRSFDHLYCIGEK
jgi:hypothetical protein